MKFGFQMPNSDQAKGIGTNQINIFSTILLQKRFGKRAGQTASCEYLRKYRPRHYDCPIERFTQNDVMLYGLAGIFRVTVTSI
jgi:hypothetical protein